MSASERAFPELHATYIDLARKAPAFAAVAEAEQAERHRFPLGGLTIIILGVAVFLFAAGGAPVLGVAAVVTGLVAALLVGRFVPDLSISLAHTAVAALSLMLGGLLAFPAAAPDGITTSVPWVVAAAVGVSIMGLTLGTQLVRLWVCPDAARASIVRRPATG